MSFEFLGKLLVHFRLTGWFDVNNVLLVELRKLFQFYLIIVVTGFGPLASKHKHVLPEAGGGCVGDIDGQGPGHLPSLLRGTGQGGVTRGARH